MKQTRRELLESIVALGSANLLSSSMTQGIALSSPSASFRLAICHETFQDWTFVNMCKGAKKYGYAGVEIAPNYLSEDPASLPQSRRVEFRDAMESEGLVYVGLHRLLSAPKGLHITTPDTLTRRKSWEYLRRLVDLCSDLGSNGIIVLGASKERSTIGGSSVEDAVKRLQEGLAEAAPVAQARGVTILLEPLAPHLSDVINTVDEAVAVVREVGSPSLQSMFDTHNAAAEKLPHGEVVRKHFKYLRHVHFNEMDGRHPGAGSYDFRSVMQVLKELSYRQWISVEVFDFSAGAEKIAHDSARFIRQQEAKLKGA